jgi:hypothetical protein
VGKERGRQGLESRGEKRRVLFLREGYPELAGFLFLEKCPEISDEVLMKENL